MKVVGHVTRRRCIGKNLTFADIQVEASDSEIFVNEKDPSRISARFSILEHRTRRQLSIQKFQASLRRKG